MKIRRFLAKDMRSALSEVSKELGADAAILSSNRVNGGVEVVAATDYEEAMLYNREQSAPDSIPENKVRSLVRDNPTVPPQVSNKVSSRTTLDDVANTGTESADVNNDEAFPTLRNVQWSQEPTLVAMREELNLLRTLLQQQVSSLSADKRRADSPVLVALEQALEALGLAHPYCQSIVQQCQESEGFDNGWQRALGYIAKDIHVADDDIIKRGGVVALVGPTGVGKTTTIAKLAAKQALKNGPDSVALITTDNYRIAAHEQIKTYGRILQVPVQAVHDEASFRQALYHFSEKQLVLIDTAGMSHFDERMQQLMQVLSNDTVKIRNYLVLSATAQASVIREAVNLFGRFKPAGCVITKLDEAASLGEIISTIINHQLSVAYTTDGQRVPEDIRTARAHHLVSKMVWLTRHHSELTSAADSVHQGHHQTGAR